MRRSIIGSLADPANLAGTLPGDNFLVLKHNNIGRQKNLSGPFKILSR